MALGTPVLLGTKAQATVATLTSNVLTAGVPVGDMVVVYICLSTNTVGLTSVTDTKGNTWVLTVGPTSATAGSFSLFRATSTINVALTTADTITVTPNATVTISFHMIQVPGASTVNALRSSTPTPSAALAAGVATSATTPTAQIGDVVLLGLGVGNGTGTGQTPSAGYTALGTTTITRALYTAYRSVAAAATQTPTETLAPDPGATNYAALTDIFRAQVVPSAPQELQAALNRVAGTTNRDAQGAANVWAGTTARNLDLLGALNVKAVSNGYTGQAPMALERCLNFLAGTVNLDVNGAAGSLV